MQVKSTSKNWRKGPLLWMIALLILALVLVACQEEEPTATPEPPAPEQAAEPTEVPPTAPPPTEEEPQEVSQPAGQLEDLVDELWVLVGYGDALNPDVVAAGTVISAVFTPDGMVSGSAGCNNYNAGYEADNEGNISVGPAATTRMACEPEIMDQEQAYLTALGGSQTYAINEEGRLEIMYDSGANFDEKLVFAPGQTPLENTEWLLVSYGDPEDPQSPADGTAITALFVPESEGANNGIVGGVATCNNYSFPYEITDDGGMTVQPGPMTLMACPLAPEQESAYVAAIGTAQSYQIMGARLEITYDGGVLVYTSLNLPLENTLWRATLLNGQPVPEEVEISALFAETEEVDRGQVSGIAACNNYSAGYTVDGENITVGPAATTRKFCEEPLNELEQGYLATLQTAETFQILGDQLSISSAEGFIVYQADRQPLQGTLWELVALGSLEDPQSPVEGSNFTAIFERDPGAPSGIMSGTTGCNEYNAAYAASLTEIKINLPSKTKNEDCPWGEGNFEVEQQYFLGLNSADSYTILGNELLISDTDGQQVFIYRGTDLPVDEELSLAPLDGTFWYLVSIDEQTLIPGSEITAQFMIDESGLTGVIGGSSGCNGYGAEISVESGAFEVSLGFSTQIFCSFPPGVSEQEQAYLAALQTASGYSLAGDQLLMPTDFGVLTYSAEQPESTLDQTAELQNITWYLVSYNTLTPVAGAEPTAFFDNSSAVSGRTGCNDYTGAYSTAPGNSLTISDIATTRAACPNDALAKQEQDFTILMQSAVNYLVAGDQLNVLTVDGGIMNFTSIPPAGPTGPTAAINAPTAATVGEIVTFDGGGSQAGSSPIVAYQWQFGDGARGSGPTVQYAYGNPGNYTVSLTVVDQLGLSNTTSQAIAVSAAADQPPTAAITGPAEVLVNGSATYDASDSTQGSRPITRYIWHFGDGSTLETSEPIATTVYRSAGVFWVTVTVVDANGLSDSAGMQTAVSANLQGTEWVLNNTLPGTSITLQFANDTLGGFGGCNSYNSTYTASPNGAMTIGLINSSQALCSDEINQQEQTYFASLSATSAWSISGNQLTLTTANGPLIFTGRPLATLYQ